MRARRSTMSMSMRAVAVVGLTLFVGLGCVPEPPPPTTTTTTSTTSTTTTTTTTTTVPAQNITVYNTGAFFVQYYVSYNGQSQYSGVFNINQGVTLTIPGTATGVGVLVQNYTGITGWQTVCTRSYAVATTAVIIVSGTTFSASCSG
jgi:hypothetical protein